MTQTPVTVTYTLEEVLGQISQKLDRMDTKFETLQKDIVEIKVGQTRLEGELKALETEVRGIGKRLDTQELINRSVVVGFILAVLAGVVKLFLPNLIS